MPSLCAAAHVQSIRAELVGRQLEVGILEVMHKDRRVGGMYHVWPARQMHRLLHCACCLPFALSAWCACLDLRACAITTEHSLTSSGTRRKLKTTPWNPTRARRSCSVSARRRTCG